jgi:flagellar assembly factor FliW
MNVEISTTRFGEISVAADEIYFFPKGLIGFEKVKEYVMVDSSKGPAIQWMQSRKHPEIAFLVSDPKNFIPLFEIRFPERAGFPSAFEPKDFNQWKTLTLLHIDREKNLLHVHIQAPILLEPVSRKGIQITTDLSNRTLPISSK